MIGWVSNNETSLNIFNNINLIDTAPAFKTAREKIEYIIPSFIKYISGDRSKSKIYGQIRRFYPEELIFLERNVVEHNIDNIKNIDNLIEDSCTLSRDLRVVIIKEGLQLSSISGYDFISFSKGDNHINTIFVESNEEITVKFTFSICLKLFDNIILSCLSDINVPTNNNIIALKYEGNNLIHVAKFIVDYMYELIYPFYKSLVLKGDDIDPIINHIYNSNFKVIEPETINELFDLVHNTVKGDADDYDYIGFILKLMNEIEDNQAHQLNLPF